MKKILIGLLLALTSSLALADGNSLIITQRNAADTGNILRTLPNPASDGLLVWRKSTALPAYLTLGSGFSLSQGVLSVSPVAGPAGAPGADGAPGSPGPAGTDGAPGAQGVQGIQGFQGIPGIAGTNGIDGTPGAAGSIGPQGPAGATGPQGIPGTPAQTFNFGLPVVRTLTVSTAYQASTPTKAAIVTVSPQCTASLTLSGGGTCTLQARIGAAGLTCAAGTVVATWTNGNTGALSVGLALNQIIGSPYGINVPTGAYFVLCPTAGTFTLSAVDQTAG